LSSGGCEHRRERPQAHPLQATQTPLETLSLLDKPAQYLRDGLSMNALNRVAAAISDTDEARRMQQAKAKLFERLRLTA
jgi:hypothetical protein